MESSCKSIVTIRNHASWLKFSGMQFSFLHASKFCRQVCDVSSLQNCGVSGQILFVQVTETLLI